MSAPVLPWVSEAIGPGAAAGAGERASVDCGGYELIARWYADDRSASWRVSSSSDDFLDGQDHVASLLEAQLAAESALRDLLGRDQALAALLGTLPPPAGSFVLVLVRRRGADTELGLLAWSGMSEGAARGLTEGALHVGGLDSTGLWIWTDGESWRQPTPLELLSALGRAGVVAEGEPSESAPGWDQLLADLRTIDVDRPIPYRLADLEEDFEEELEPRTCSGCGCTDAEGCFEGCWWVADDLCSSCASDPEALQVVVVPLRGRQPIEPGHYLVRVQPEGWSRGHLDLVDVIWGRPEVLPPEGQPRGERVLRLPYQGRQVTWIAQVIDGAAASPPEPEPDAVDQAVRDLQAFVQPPAPSAEACEVEPDPWQRAEEPARPAGDTDTEREVGDVE